MKYTNFYETVKEADMRLKNTVILYDGEPYYVLCITPHSDGVFRLYMETCNGRDMAINTSEYLPSGKFNSDHPGLDKKMDGWMESADGKRYPGVLRKKMNSPLFNRFRPFALGMVNVKDYVVFAERQPLRPKTEQGLTRNMIVATLISMEGKKSVSPPEAQSVELSRTIRGDYPTAKECVDALLDPNVDNKALAFNRNFTFVKGPLDTVFLFYKEECVGSLPDGLTSLTLGRQFKHYREVCAELGVFGNIL